MIKREQRQVVLHFAERENQRSLAGGKSNSRATLKKKIFLLFVLLCAVVQGAWAKSYVEQTDNYEVTVTGPKTLRIKVPVYDEDGSDHWVYNGNLKVTWTDGNNTQQTKTILHWGGQK